MKSHLAAGPAVLAGCGLAAVFSSGVAQAATPPQIFDTAATQVTTNAATLNASIDPAGKQAKYHFLYTPQSTFESSGFAKATRTVPDGKVPPSVVFSADLAKGSIFATNVSVTTANGVLGPGQGVTGPLGTLEPATTIAAIEEGIVRLSKPAEETKAAAKLTATGPQPVSARVEGLTPATTYRFRAIADNGEEAEGPIGAFNTYSLPLVGLPDSRAYEQASPVEKNAGDAMGTVPTVKASPDGTRVTFISTGGMPGGEGSAEMPIYLASRDPLGWSTQGLLPPPSYGQFAQVLGWSPDFSAVYEEAKRYGNPPMGAFLTRSSADAAIAEAFPRAPKALYYFAGASADGQTVVFESRSKLATAPGSPEVIEGQWNAYAWNRESGELHLLSAENSGGSLPKGALAGPYDWVKGTNPSTLTDGGAHRQYYLQDMHAVAADGSTYFTAAGSGQLYRRTDPTEPQSALAHAGEPDEECTEPTKACTVNVSASEKTNGGGPNGIDAAGTSPAAFRAASADGKTAFFTSAEKLTDGATTGPEPTPPMIGRANFGDGSGIDETFLPATAGGIAVHDGFVYWADPVHGAIGRAKLDGAGGPTERKEDFIVPGLVEVEPGVEVPSKPQYVAVDGEHVYWSDATDGKKGHGTIGRANTDGKAESIEPEFIAGASNPQGVAVNTTFIYWSNVLPNGAGTRSIGRAEISGNDPEPAWTLMFGGDGRKPFGLSVTDSHIYLTVSEDSDVFTYTNEYLARIDLSGSNGTDVYVGQNLDLRGIAVDAGHIYWAAQRTGQIGRGNLNLSKESVENNFISAQGSLKGLAVDSEHLYFSANGEVQNPGNDLYRYDAEASAGQRLTDLAVDTADTNGAEVKGVLGAASDGSDLYFTANGIPDGLTESHNAHGESASPGDCRGSMGREGECNLYRWHEDGSPRGEVSFIARLATTGVKTKNDLTNWIGTPTGTPVSTSRMPGKTSWVSADGQSLLFRSQRQLTDYENDGLAELYLYRVGKGVSCVSCNPTGVPPTSSVSIASINPTALIPAEPAALASRNLNAAGTRAFFETTDPLSLEDTNGEARCPPVGTSSQGFPSCQDVYEWEAPGTGSCAVGAPGYSPQNQGCLYLLSSGKADYASFFLDASESGDDSFLFTRSPLVAQDGDQLLDVYDARVGGGIPSQNEVAPPPCEAEGCKPGATPPPGFDSPPTATFQAPPQAKPKPCKKGRVRKGGRCVKRQAKEHGRGHHRGKKGGRRRAAP